MGRITLEHAGPAPVGTTRRDLLPDGMTLREIGLDLLRHGGWLFGGLSIPGPQYDCIDMDDDAERESFSFGPRGTTEGDFFALAREAAGRVVCLYVSPEFNANKHEAERTTGEISRGDHANKIIQVFAKMHTGLTNTDRPANPKTSGETR